MWKKKRKKTANLKYIAGWQTRHPRRLIFSCPKGNHINEFRCKSNRFSVGNRINTGVHSIVTMKQDVSWKK
jgi:hypothetical protein